ncbi:hypothetical protein RSAG8_05111, partial [Rhizoctonia solani AG-8 WAC10335]
MLQPSDLCRSWFSSLAISPRCGCGGKSIMGISEFFWCLLQLLLQDVPLGSYCSGPITYPIVARSPAQRRTMWVGSFIYFGSLFGASFVKKLWQIVLLQGGGYGLGGSLLCAPTQAHYQSIRNQFYARRGLANGVIYAGTTVCGLVLPLVLHPPSGPTEPLPPCITYLSPCWSYSRLFCPLFDLGPPKVTIVIQP